MALPCPTGARIANEALVLVVPSELPITALFRCFMLCQIEGKHALGL